MDSAVTQRIVEGCTGVDLQLPALNLEPHAAERRRAKKAGQPLSQSGEYGVFPNRSSAFFPTVSWVRTRSNSAAALHTSRLG